MVAKRMLEVVTFAMVVITSQQPALSQLDGDHFQRAMEFRLDGFIDAAIAEYIRGLEINPDSVDGHVQLGLVLLEEKGDIDGAISEFVTALSIDPTCNFCQQRLDEALEHRNSKSADQVSRGNNFYSAGQLGRAAAAYRIAICLDPNDAVAHNSLAWTLYRLGVLEEGLAEVDQALKISPGNPEFVNTLACLLFDKGDIEGALSNWQRAIALSKQPNAADYYGLAIGHLDKKDSRGAVRYFSKAVTIDPKYMDSAYIRDRVGMSIKAVSHHDELLRLTNKTVPLSK
ncbi:MAG: tetratricopeptide repeat protein [Candidatus Melainabacteria bacterium]|nr:tetratricopeptide repeat protein [Candidatus Melainabacteria bacterium]